MRRVLLLVLALAAGAAPGYAQTTPPPQPEAEPSSVGFLPRFDFHISVERLVSDEKRFEWDGNFGSDLDIVDYGGGRVGFVANYQAILGSEFREFDPNQGNYTLELSASAREGAFELAGVFHHVSRHLSDRPKRDPVDWNMVGVRVQGGGVHGRADLRGRVDVRRAIQKSRVDYRWELEGDLDTRVALQPRVAFIAAGGLRVVGVDGTGNRGTQYGFRGEGGVRLNGRGAALDLFVAAERRIDPYQLEFSTATWMTTGFRISSPGAPRVP